MHYRTLGSTGLKVSLLSFGTGGPSRLGQPKGASQREQDFLIRKCLDLGINLFDTSERYGRSEEILGKALRETSRESYILASKCCCIGFNGRLKTSQQLLDSVERSLRLLQTDYIDIMQFHGLTLTQYDDVVDSLYPVMDRLKEHGKIGFVGFSTDSMDPTHDVTIRALTVHPNLWDTIMLKYGVLYQSAGKLALPLAREKNVGIINMAAIRLDLSLPRRLSELILDWKRRGFIMPDSLPDDNPLDWIINDEVDSVVSAGYKFAVSHPAVATVLTGTSNLEHLEQNVDAINSASLRESDIFKLKNLFSRIAERSN